MIDLTKELDGCIAWIKNWFKNDSGNAKGIIVGISGGKDSSVVAAMCAKAIGKDNVFGVVMPNGEQSDLDDAVALCNTVGIRYCIVNINDVYNAELATCLKCMPIADEAKINIAPRIRMMTLYTLGQTMKYRVAGTGNACEAYVGYFTKWGDGAHDFNPIANFTVAEVVAMGKMLGIPDYLMDKAPADGLCGKSDEDSLGFTYEDVANIINCRYNLVKSATYDKIEAMHNRNMHKLMDIPKYIVEDSD